MKVQETPIPSWSEVLAGLPRERVLGPGTEADVLAWEGRHEKKLCELWDGILVEKAMGFRESIIAGVFIELLRRWSKQARSGIVAASDGFIRLMPGQVRIPDVAFYRWSSLPGAKVPQEAIPAIVPNLAIEVLSASNTQAEMSSKRYEYFAGGCEEVWEIDVNKRKIQVYSEPELFRTLTEEDVLDGGSVLPGFSVALRDVFAELDDVGPAEDVGGGV